MRPANGIKNRRHKMSDLTHLFKVNQKVRCKLDNRFYNGTVRETYADHIIVDIPEISDHCYFENGFNMDCVFPDYNFKGKEE
jgi:hypothetical protein